MLGCFNPNLGQKMDKHKFWVKNAIPKFTVEVGLKFEITFLTQQLGLSIFDPNLRLECIHQDDKEL